MIETWIPYAVNLVAKSGNTAYEVESIYSLMTKLSNSPSSWPNHPWHLNQDPNHPLYFSCCLNQPIMDEFILIMINPSYCFWPYQYPNHPPNPHYYPYYLHHFPVAAPATPQWCCHLAQNSGMAFPAPATHHPCSTWAGSPHPGGSTQTRAHMAAGRNPARSEHIDYGQATISYNMAWQL